MLLDAQTLFYERANNQHSLTIFANLAIVICQHISCNWLFHTNSFYTYVDRDRRNKILSARMLKKVRLNKKYPSQIRHGTHLCIFFAAVAVELKVHNDSAHKFSAGQEWKIEKNET